MFTHSVATFVYPSFVVLILTGPSNVRYPKARPFPYSAGNGVGVGGGVIGVEVGVGVTLGVGVTEGIGVGVGAQLP